MTRISRDIVRTTPAYSLAEAAHYLNLPLTTLRAWCLGQPGFRAVIRMDGKNPWALSFLNLVEAHVLAAMREILQAHLRRIERDGKGLPIKLFLFTRRDGAEPGPAPVVVDPRIAFGRPVLVGRSVPTAVLADRFKAGESLKELARDYETSPAGIEEAIRCELDRQAA